MGNVTNTVSGNIASFRTSSRVPLESLKFHFKPKQASGIPSIQNPIPIEGWTSLNWTHAKGNLFDKDSCEIHAGKIRNDQGVESNSQSYFYVDVPILLDSNATYQLLVKSQYARVYYLNKDGSWISRSNMYISNNSDEGYPIVFSVMDASRIQIQLINGSNLADIKLVYATSQYISIKMNNVGSFYKETGSVSWADDQGVIYGGYFDLISGKLYDEYYRLYIENVAGGIQKVTRFEDYDAFWFDMSNVVVPNSNDDIPDLFCDIYETVSWNYRLNNARPGIVAMMTYEGYIRVQFFTEKNAYATVDDFKQSFIGHTVLFKRLGIQPYQLTAQPRMSYLDTNNFWSDTNDVTEVSYPIAESKDILDVRKKIILNEPHIETVSGPIASFHTDMKAPLKTLKMDLPIIQVGEGIVSPSNVRRIYPYNIFNIFLFKKYNNLSYTSDNENVIVDSNGVLIYEGPSQTNMIVTLTLQNDILLKNNTTYSFMWGFSNGSCRNGRQAVLLKDNDNNTIMSQREDLSSAYYSGHVYGNTFTPQEDVYLHSIKFYFGIGTAHIRVKPYLVEDPNHWRGSAFSSPSDCYAGFINVLNNTMTLTHKMIDMGELDWQQINASQTRKMISAISPNDAQVPTQRSNYCELYQVNYAGASSLPDKSIKPSANTSNRLIWVRDDDATDLESFISSVQGYKYVYSLAEPLTFTIPSSISITDKVFIGDNILIWPESSNIELKYWTY